MYEQAPLLIIFLAFISVAGIVVALGRLFAEEASIHRRLNLAATAGQDPGATERATATFLGSLVAKVDERRFGIEGPLKSKLRRDLIRAGFFSESATQTYILARLGLVLALPVLVIALLKIFATDTNFYLELLALAGAALIGVIGVDAYLARRRRLLQHDNRVNFPDLIDMLDVCVDAGLSLDAAFGRIATEVMRRSRSLGMNLLILGAEGRAGRTMPDALASFADRLDLDEVRAFAIMLRQSFELGTDVADALRVFSEEMRAKRLLRAEEAANKLPVKMVLPLGSCIFPVILMVVLVPVFIRLIAIFHRV
jgi:tight adherence protein C